MALAHAMEMAAKMEETTKADTLLDALNKFLNANEPAFELTGPIKVPVMLPDKTYKTTPLVGAEEFLIKKARRGAKGQIIFTGVPMDAQSFIEADFAEKVAFDALLNFDRTLAREFGVGETAMSELEPADLWRVTKELILRNIEQAEEERKAKEQAELELLNVDNPNWGMF